MRFLLSALALATVLTAACTAAPGASSAPPAGGGTASGPGLSIADALAVSADGPLLISGALIIARGEARLCSVVLWSFPPQCGGDSILVFGLDPATVPGIQTANGVTWADQVQLLGTLDGRVLTITQR